MVAIYPDLAGKFVPVTGGASGIGGSDRGLGMPVYGHAHIFRVRVSQCFDLDRLPSLQKWTSVRIPRTTALSVFTPTAL